MGFQIVFNISKIKKPCKLIGQVHFCLQLEKEVLKKCFRQITKTTMVHHLTLKKAHIDGSISFQNIFFQKYWQFVILEHYGHVRHALPHPRQTS